MYSKVYKVLSRKKNKFRPYFIDKSLKFGIYNGTLLTF